MTDRKMLKNYIQRSGSEIIAEDEEQLNFTIFDGKILNVYFDENDNIKMMFI